MYTETCDGKKEIKVGDVISTKDIDALKYDRGMVACDEGDCRDSFSYRALNNWQGKTKERTLVIEFESDQAQETEFNSGDFTEKDSVKEV